MATLGEAAFATRPNGTPLPASLAGRTTRGTRRARRAPWGTALVLAFLGTATIGFNTTRVAGSPLADVVFLTAAGVVGVKLLMGDTRHLGTSEMRRAPVQFVVGSLVLLSASVLSSLWVEDPAASFTIVMRFAWLTIVWSWLLRSVASSPLALDRLLLGYEVTVFISAVASVGGYVGVLHLSETDGGRQMGFTAHPNQLGGLLAVGLPFLILDARTTRSGSGGRWRHSLVTRLLVSGFVLFAITTTGSMSALLAGVAGLVTVVGAQMMARGKPRRRHGPLVAIGVTFVVLLGISGLVASGAPAVERFIGLQEGHSGVSHSVASRGEQDAFVIDRLHEHLVMGTGFAQGRGEVQEETGYGIHNYILKLLYEAGVPAVIGLLTLWLLAARQGWRLLFSTRGTELHTLVVALLGALVTATVFAQFQPLAYERYYWFPLVMIGATWSLRRQQLRRARLAAEAAEAGAGPDDPIGPVGPVPRANGGVAPAR